VIVQRHAVVHRKAKPKPKEASRRKAHPASPLGPAHILVPRPRVLVSPARRPVAALDTAGNSSSSSPPVVGILLSLALVLSVALLGLAAAPLRTVPRGLRDLIYDRRRPLFLSAVVIYATTGLSLAIVLVSS